MNAENDLVIYTLRFGNPDWLATCTESLDRWAYLNGLDMMVMRDWEEDYPAEKFAIIDMLRHFLRSGRQRMLFMDADVWVRPGAPLPPVFAPGFHIKPDGHVKTARRWRQWHDQHFGGLGRSGWEYLNTGVWACDREAARMLLDEVAPPFIEGRLEQHQMNHWLIQAANKGMLLHHLPDEWNLMWHEFDSRARAAWFTHLTGETKLDKLRLMQDWAARNCSGGGIKSLASDRPDT